MAIAESLQFLKSKRFVSSLLLIAVMIQQGCRDATDSFFSGRPSEMSMVHNRALDGRVESIIELLKVPNRFPNAKESHMINWQGSIIAWWQNENGRKRIVAAILKLTDIELESLEKWVSVRSKYDTVKTRNAITLDEIGNEIKTFRAGKIHSINEDSL